MALLASHVSTYPDHTHARQSLAAGQIARQKAWRRRRLDEAVPLEQFADTRLNLQQQWALDRDAFKMMVEANARRVTSARPDHRPCSN